MKIQPWLTAPLLSSKQTCFLSSNPNLAALFAFVLFRFHPLRPTYTPTYLPTYLPQLWLPSFIHFNACLLRSLLYIVGSSFISVLFSCFLVFFFSRLLYFQFSSFLHCCLMFRYFSSYLLVCPRKKNEMLFHGFLSYFFCRIFSFFYLVLFSLLFSSPCIKGPHLIMPQCCLY